MFTGTVTAPYNIVVIAGSLWIYVGINFTSSLFLTLKKYSLSHKQTHADMLLCI